MVGWTFFGSCFLSFWGFVNADGIIVQEGSSLNDYVGGVVVADGLPIVAGTVGGTFPNMTFISSAGGYDALVVKYDTSGTLAAIKTFATTSNDEIRASAIDDSDNV